MSAHGTHNRYAVGCRCVDCRAAHKEYRQARRELLASRTHGHNACYVAGCRCRACTSAHATYQRLAWRGRKVQLPEPVPEPTLVERITRGQAKATAREWMAQARCRGMGPDAFYVERFDDAGVVEAKLLCTECTVRAECLAYGMSERFGIWGGLTELERRNERQRRYQQRRRTAVAS